MSRRIAREELFKIVFESESLNVLPDTLLDNYLSRGEVILTKNGENFFRQYVAGISQHSEEVNNLITERMENWNLERIGVVERALIKCAVYELTYEDTGYEIVINEVVELAKIYGDEKSPEFINGVIAKFVVKR